MPRNPLRAYMHWLHTRWPAGTVETLPLVNDDGTCNVPGVYIVGDLTGIPLLKFSLDSGARAVERIAGEPGFKPGGADDAVRDIAIVGGGVAGMAAAVEAARRGLNYVVLEAAQPLSTIHNFPRAKPIFTYPTDMTPAGGLQVAADVKEALVEELEGQIAAAGIEVTDARVERIAREGDLLRIELADGKPAVRARRAIVAIGRSGNYRKLNVPGEHLDKVTNRLHDPRDYTGKRALVVGGGDSALEMAIALTDAGAEVTLSYRGAEFARAKPDNFERVQALSDEGRLRLAMSSAVAEIRPDAVTLSTKDGEEILANDVVFAMIGREPPLDFFRRSGIRLRGEWRPGRVASLALVLVFCVWMYHWKKTGLTIAGVPPLNWISEIGDGWAARGWFPYNVPAWWAGLGGAFAEPAHLLGTLRISLGEPGFYYSLAYCSAVVVFGIRRIRRRKTPYVTWQTIALMLIQCIPLFVLPYILLPWIGNNGGFDGGFARALADSLFPEANYGHGREYWRAFGLILAWPLFIWNVFTAQPLWGWLAISVAQTFVFIPAMIFFWGKGAYCGWICSCGALAETLGDAHRHKMPHGPLWNRLNMIGQAILAFALIILGLRVAGWALGDGSWPARGFDYLMYRLPIFNYVWFVDLFWAGILGVGLYFHFSGRVWCRFACPLAALMHIYARFSRFRIFAEKKKCISCNVCTSVCHQGIDVMSFANKGLPMEDPQCVRCSACVQSCPTGVLEFGRVGANGEAIKDRLAASKVLIAERGRAADTSPRRT